MICIFGYILLIFRLNWVKILSKLYKSILFIVIIMKGVSKYLMNYTPTLLHDSIHIDKLYTIHYFEYMCDFTFEGEQHDFWEFLYVDKGEVFATSGAKEILLKKGDIVFHQPDEFHSVNATGHSAPNLIVVSFHLQALPCVFLPNGFSSLMMLSRSCLQRLSKKLAAAFPAGWMTPILPIWKRNRPIYLAVNR